MLQELQCGENNGGSSSVKAQQSTTAAEARNDNRVDNCVQPKSKKELRQERKKRKLLGLSALMMLNEQDGIGKHHRSIKKNPSSLAQESDNNNLQQVESGLNGHTTPVNGNEQQQLKQILAKNRTAYNIDEECNEHELTIVDAKRRKAVNGDAAAIHDNNAAGGGVGKPSPVVECRTLAVDKSSTTLHPDSEYRALKAFVNQRKSMRYTPRIMLKPIGQNALLDRNQRTEERIPLLLDDIQALLMQTFLRTDSPVTPRWVSIDKSTKLTHTTVLIVEGFSCEDFVTYREHMPNCSENIFGPQLTLQVVCPWSKILEEIACVPLSDSHKDVLVAEYGSLEAAMRMCKDQMLVRKSIFRNIGPTVPLSNYSDVDLPPGDMFPRTLLLLSPIQMINEGYPLPLAGTLENRYKDYVTTNDCYQPVNPRSPLFGIDCEMCGGRGDKSLLTRVSVIDESGKLVYDELVKPGEKIYDYRTAFSGITAEMLRPVRTTLADVQRDLRKLLPPDAILVGHSLNSDLDALKMLHPYAIDTSIIYNVTGNPMHKQKLRILAKKFLNEDIQTGKDGHCSAEDCSASLRLVQLKLANSIYFGDQWLEDRRNYHSFQVRDGRNGIAQETAHQPVAASSQQSLIMATLFSHAKKRNKVSVITTNAKEELQTFQEYFGTTIPASRGKKQTAQQQWLSLCRTSSPEETIVTTANNCLEYDFNLAYVRLSDEYQTATRLNLAKQIDGWVGRLHEALSLNGLLLVLLVGGKEVGEMSLGTRTAVAMVQTKKPSK
ncbi:uncharacterized protein LOC126561684 [Anopheles maculipalpis]|uniref:uncharacterized protein LOC126561684 n=1 Tax=Anopheles maculipalpis TaxID=1496333 RepID=UPI002158F3FE|nr:uncharacterized protein LOC126561684 [Anopheles maculipalpis]